MGASIDGENINWTDDEIYIAIMKSTYVQDMASLHWSEILAYEIDETGDYVAGGQQLITIEPYIELTLDEKFAYAVYTANAAATPTYNAVWTGVTFTGAPGVIVYKKGATPATSPVLTYGRILDSARNPGHADGDMFFIDFGTPGETLGIFHQLIGTQIVV